MPGPRSCCGVPVTEQDGGLGGLYGSLAASPITAVGQTDSPRTGVLGKCPLFVALAGG